MIPRDVADIDDVVVSTHVLYSETSGSLMFIDFFPLHYRHSWDYTGYGPCCPCIINTPPPAFLLYLRVSLISYLILISSIAITSYPSYNIMADANADPAPATNNTPSNNTSPGTTSPIIADPPPSINTSNLPTLYLDFIPGDVALIVPLPLTDQLPFKWSLPLRSKSKASTILRHWIIAIERQTPHRLKCLITDNRELASTQIHNFCTELGILHLFTAPYTSTHNGHAERLHRTIMDRACATRISCNASPNMWDEFCATAAYLHNLTHTSSNQDKSPYELWHSRKPPLLHLHEIGCRAFSLITTNNPKILHRSVPCILIGYALKAKAYWLWDPTTDRIFNSFHVSFIETRQLLPPPNIQYPTIPSHTLPPSPETDCPTPTSSLIPQTPFPHDYTAQYPVRLPNTSSYSQNPIPPQHRPTFPDISSSNPVRLSNNTIIPQDIPIPSEITPYFPPPINTVLPQNIPVSPQYNTVTAPDNTILTNNTTPSRNNILSPSENNTVFPPSSTVLPQHNTVSSQYNTASQTENTILPQNVTVTLQNYSVPPQNNTVPLQNTISPQDSSPILPAIPDVASSSNNARLPSRLPVPFSRPPPCRSSRLAARNQVSLASPVPTDLNDYSAAFLSDFSPLRNSHYLLPLAFNDSFLSFPSVGEALMALATGATDLSLDPDNDPLWATAIASPEREFWVAGARDELQSLKDLKVFVLVPRSEIPRGQQPLKGKLVCKRKRDDKGNISRYKVHYIAKGFAQ